jgi:hypothetical protein
LMLTRLTLECQKFHTSVVHWCSGRVVPYLDYLDAWNSLQLQFFGTYLRRNGISFATTLTNVKDEMRCQITWHPKLMGCSSKHNWTERPFSLERLFFVKLLLLDAQLQITNGDRPLVLPLPKLSKTNIRTLTLSYWIGSLYIYLVTLSWSLLG